jgi:hypothetical protein
MLLAAEARNLMKTERKIRGDGRQASSREYLLDSLAPHPPFSLSAASFVLSAYLTITAMAELKLFPKRALVLFVFKGFVFF